MSERVLCRARDLEGPASSLTAPCNHSEGHGGGHAFAYWSRLVEILKWRMAADHDNVLAIDGDEGSGKSTLALQLARDLDPGFRPQDVIYDFQDLESTFSVTARRRVYLVDEGVNLVFSRDFASYGNKQLVKLLMQARQLNCTLIFVIPNFWWLDKYLREHRVRWWIHVLHRGRATVTQRVQNWRDGSTVFKEMFIKTFPGPDPTSDFWRTYLERKTAGFQANFAPDAEEPEPDQGLGFSNRAGKAL